jgi:hypothetical protein
MPRFILLFLFFVGNVAAVSLRFEGYKPHGIDSVLLVHEYSRIGKSVGLDTKNDSVPVTIIFYRASEQRKSGIRLPEWGGGGALGKDTIVLPVDKQSAFYRSDIEKILLHEMVHSALARAYGSLRVPRWFHEGVAMTLSGEISFEQQLQLSRAIILHSLVPLDSMEFLNRFSSWRAQVAYSQCHFAVQFLIDTYGMDLIPELLLESRRTRRFESACLTVFGLTVPELQKLLDKEMASRYRILFIIGDYSLVWGGIFLLAVVAFVVTAVRKRRKMRAMDEEERALYTMAPEGGNLSCRSGSVEESGIPGPNDSDTGTYR